MASYSCEQSIVTTLLLLLCLTDLTYTSGQECSSYECRLHELSKVFEEALVNSGDALWKLQQIYFNPSSDHPSPALVSLSVVVTVNDIIDDQCDELNRNCTCFDFFGIGDLAFEECSPFESDDCSSGQWIFYQSYCQLQTFSPGSSNLERLLATSEILNNVFFAFDPTLYSIMKLVSGSTELQSRYMDDERVTIKMHSNTTLHVNPCSDNAVSALTMVLIWAKAYGRANGLPTEKQDTDKSTVTCSENPAQDCSAGLDLFDPGCIFLQFLSIFILSNLLLLSLTLINLRKTFLWLLRQGEQAKMFYSASAVVFTLVNVITLISDIIIIALRKRSWALAKIPLVLLILALELPLACFNTHITYRSNLKYHRFVHAFFFCQIVWFLHRLVNDVIISVAFFIIAPAQTLGIDALLLTIIGSYIAFSVISHKRSRANSRHKKCCQSCSFVLCMTTNFVMICGLLFSIVMVFIVFVDNGLKSAVVLSLIPTLAVSVIGYIIKELYKSTSPESGNMNGPQLQVNRTTIQNINEQRQETTPLLQGRH